MWLGYEYVVNLVYSGMTALVGEVVLSIAKKVECTHMPIPHSHIHVAHSVATHNFFTTCIVTAK